MNKSESILKTIRKAVGLDEETADFDTDLLIHINGAIGKLSQNGVNCKTAYVDLTTVWSDLENPIDVNSAMSFELIPLFIMMSTKIIFDPPPPSTVEHYSKNIDELLWRIRLAYEEPIETIVRR